MLIKKIYKNKKGLKKIPFFSSTKDDVKNQIITALFLIIFLVKFCHKYGGSLIWVRGEQRSIETKCFQFTGAKWPDSLL